MMYRRSQKRAKTNGLFTFVYFQLLGQIWHSPQTIAIQNEDAWQRHSYLQRRCLGSGCDEKRGRV